MENDRSQIILSLTMINATEICGTQGTDEWLEARAEFAMNGGLSASEAPSLVKRGYDSLAKIIRIRLGIEAEIPPDLFKQQLFERGHDLEPLARQAAAEYLNVPIKECGFWVNDLIPTMGASPDGIGEYNGHKFVLECKAPLSTDISQKKFGRYCVQAAWQMMVLGYDLAYIVVYHPTEPILMWHLRKDSFLEGILLREFNKFQESLQTRKYPTRTREIADYADWEERMFVEKWRNGTSFIRLPHPQNMSSFKFAPVASSPIPLTPTCQCGKTKVERTVKKDGPNNGKRFWACPGSCEGTFEPIDEFVKLNDFAANRSRPVKRQFSEPAPTTQQTAAQIHEDMQGKIAEINSKLDSILSVLIQATQANVSANQ